MSDRDLATLLGLADGDRPLPPGVEDRLLADVLSTASQPRSTVSRPMRELRPAPPPPDTPRRWWVTPAATAAAVAAVLAIGLSIPRPQTGIAPTDQPSSTTPLPAPATLTGAELCSELATGLVDTGLVGRAVIVSNLSPGSLERVAGLTAELADRLDNDPVAPAVAGAASRYDAVALALRDGSEHVNAAHSQARTATSETGLLELATTCPVVDP